MSTSLRTGTVMLGMGVLLLVPACLACRPSPRTVVAGRRAPTWLALGREAYRYDEALEDQRAPLALLGEPRWFGGMPRVQAWKRLDQIPLYDRGARLDLSVVSVGEKAITLELVLHAGLDRPLWRETEHRWTNVAPFLFGLYADGRPVTLPQTGFMKTGGIHRFVKLVPAGGTRRWTLRVVRRSLLEKLPSPAPSSVEIVAAFCERQHAVEATLGPRAMTLPEDPDLDIPFEGAPVLVRSRVQPLPLGLER